MIVIALLVINTLINKLLDVSNKDPDKVMRRSCYSGSIMCLQQLIFIWKVRHLVVTLFADISGNLLMNWAPMYFVHYQQYKQYSLPTITSIIFLEMYKKALFDKPLEDMDVNGQRKCIVKTH